MKETAAEAVAASQKMAAALARLNFVQPVRRENWPDTLGQALRPVRLDKDALKRLLGFEGNVERARYISRSKPVYYVDCDIAGMLMVSAAQALGWDVRLVEVPDHHFIRWHLADGRTVNWDWTVWASMSDTRYARDEKLDDASVRRGLYLKSYSAAEAYGYFLGLIASNVDDLSAKISLFDEAITAGPNIRTTANNYAWTVATHPDKAEGRMRTALSLALQAWSARPQDSRIADTVACVFAALNDAATAQAVEDYALQHARNGKEKAGLRSNRERIGNGQLCQ